MLKSPEPRNAPIVILMRPTFSCHPESRAIDKAIPPCHPESRAGGKAIPPCHPESRAGGTRRRICVGGRKPSRRRLRTLEKGSYLHSPAQILRRLRLLRMTLGGKAAPPQVDRPSSRPESRPPAPAVSKRHPQCHPESRAGGKAIPPCHPEWCAKGAPRRIWVGESGAPAPPVLQHKGREELVSPA